MSGNWQAREAPPSSLLFPRSRSPTGSGSASSRVSVLRAPPGLSSSLPSSSPWSSGGGGSNGFCGDAGASNDEGRRRGRQRSASLDALWLPQAGKATSPVDPLNVVGSIFTSTDSSGRRRSTPAQAASVALPCGLGLADAFRRQSDPLHSVPFVPRPTSSFSSSASTAGGDLFATELVCFVLLAGSNASNARD